MEKYIEGQIEEAKRCTERTWAANIELLKLENKTMKEYLADHVCDVDELIDELTNGRTAKLRGK